MKDNEESIVDLKIIKEMSQDPFNRSCEMQKDPKSIAISPAEAISCQDEQIYFVEN